jgi:OOP family OmpA-OmpF porin
MKKTIGLAISACTALLAGQAALAGTDVGSWYVAPQLQGVWLDKARNADDSGGFAIAFGKALSEKWNVEVGLGSSSHDAAAGQKLKLNSWDVDAMRVFYRDQRVNPYITFGLGRLEEKRAGAKDSDFYIKYGVGVLADLAKNADKGTNLQLRGEIAGRRNDTNPSETVDYLIGAGLLYSWGGSVTPKAPPDSDGDGVIDPLDKCPGTPAGTPVDANGCELDSDGDGVVDSKDKCPNTPAGAKVNEDGCELDSDGDGVVDSLDKCPGTPPGTKVDSNGCECGDIILRGVTFVTNSAEITPQGQLVLDSVAFGLAKRTGTKIEIRGHTDDVGSETANLALSQRRADSVKAYLVGKGLAADDLTTIGLGEMSHIAPNDTADGREQNRRVTLQVLSVVCEERASEDLVLRGVTFVTGSAKITPTSKLVLDSAIAYLNHRPQSTAQVRGHTDDVGNDDANMKLSQSRAEAVRDYLVKGGIDAARLAALGLGETDHMTSNDTPDGRAQNRRVTLRIKP